MKQLIINDDGSIKMVSSEIPKVESEDFVLMKVVAAGVNRADVLQREGKYASSSNVPGLEVSGYIGNKKACALVPHSGYSEYVVVSKNHVIYLDDNFDLEIAASLPEALCTSYMSLFHFGKLTKESNVLIHAGSSGVGTFMIQICKIFGNNVITSVGEDYKVDLCKSLGADFVFNYNHQYDEQEIKKYNINILRLLHK